MNPILATMALGTALLGTPAAAQAQDPVPEMDRKDMECVALFATMAGRDPEYVVAGTVGMAYFLGRLEGRNPGINQSERFSNWLHSQDEAALGTMLAQAGERCAGELETLGSSMVAAGSAGA